MGHTGQEGQKEVSDGIEWVKQSDTQPAQEHGIRADTVEYDHACLILQHLWGTGIVALTQGNIFPPQNQYQLPSLGKYGYPDN